MCARGRDRRTGLSPTNPPNTTGDPSGLRAETDAERHERIVAALLEADAYPRGVRDGISAGIERIETHISTVLLAGDRVFKIKKPVNLGFLDYSTEALRHLYCREEIRLNRRLAPGVYLGVAEIVQDAEGRVRVGGVEAGAGADTGTDADADADTDTDADADSDADADATTVLAHAVVMRRLPSDRMLDALLRRGAVDRSLVERLADLLVGFHARCPTGPGVDEWGAPEEVRRQLDENLAGIEAHVGATDPMRIATPAIASFLRDEATAELDRIEPVIAARVMAGRVREGHGDLHAGNVCVLDDGILAYDCIEFSPRFRCRDVACEIAFLAMDLDASGFRAFGTDLVRTYAERAGDPELVGLVPFHKLHLAVVRAKVTAIRGASASAPTVRADARADARRYVHLATAYALPPVLVLMCGLPGTGKSHVARALAAPFEAEHVQADRVRKGLAGLSTTDRAGAELGIYSPEFTQRTYTALRDRARVALAAGRSVVVDATLPSSGLRAPLLALADECGIPLVLAEVRCDDDTVRARLARRVDADTDASDADWAVYDAARRRFEPPDEVAPARRVSIDGNAEAADAVEAVLDALVRQLDGQPKD